MSAYKAVISLAAVIPACPESLLQNDSGQAGMTENKIELMQRFDTGMRKEMVGCRGIEPRTRGFSVLK